MCVCVYVLDVCMTVCVCVSVCLYVSACLCICAYVCVCASVCVCFSVCVYVCVCLCVFMSRCVYDCVCVFECFCMSVCAWAYLYMCICVYMSLYTCVCVHVYACVYVRVHVSLYVCVWVIDWMMLIALALAALDWQLWVDSKDRRGCWLLCGPHPGASLIRTDPASQKGEQVMHIFTKRKHRPVLLAYLCRIMCSWDFVLVFGSNCWPLQEGAHRAAAAGDTWVRPMKRRVYRPMMSSLPKIKRSLGQGQRDSCPQDFLIVEMGPRCPDAFTHTWICPNTPLMAQISGVYSSM